MTKLSHLTLVDLLNKEREFEFPKTLEEDGMLVGVRAEIVKRSGDGQEDLRDEIKRLKSENIDLYDQVHSLETRLRATDD